MAERTLYQHFTAKQKMGWRLHTIVNMVCWRTKWRYEWLKRVNDYLGGVWLKGYFDFKKLRDKEVS